MSDKEDLKVITKAMELVKHTITLTSNCNRYPKKYRFSIVDRMQLISMDIYENLMEANRTLIGKNCERSELQTMSITGCDKLLFYIDLSCQLDIISFKSTEYWSNMVRDVKYMTIAWRKTSK